MTERLDFLNRNLLPVVHDKRVWDFCCGTGMNGVYALENGAQYVHFSDVRPETFKNYTNGLALDKDRYNWHHINADDIRTNAVNDPYLDIIIYHGHFYHARNHYEIVNTLSNTRARYMCFESKGSNSKDKIITWHTENQNDKWWDTYELSKRENVMVGNPSIAWCRTVFTYFGWTILDETLMHRPDLNFYKWRFWMVKI